MSPISVPGRLTRDPEPRQIQTKSGNHTVVEVNIASDSTRKDREGNYITNFFRASFWDNTGNTVMNHFHKGDPIFVTGELVARDYQDKNGQSRTSLEIDGASFGFLPAPSRNRGNQNPNNVPQSNYNQGMNNQLQNNQNTPQGQNNGFNNNQNIDPNDLPFPNNTNQNNGQQFNQGQQPNWMGQGNNQ